MKELKLTILIEAGVKSDMMNLFGTDYIIVGDRVKFMQYTFPAVKMLTPFKIAPVLQLLQSYEREKTLHYKMFHLKDDKDSSFSPVYFECIDGQWNVIRSATGDILKTGSDLLNLL